MTMSRDDYDKPIRFALGKVRINSQGYDAAGNYCGRRLNGRDLYRYIADDGTHGFVDAANRDSAKAQIRQNFCNATFYR